MSEKDLHSNRIDNKEDQLFSKGKIIWEKSENDIWTELENKISKQAAGVSYSLVSRIAKWSVAALILLLIGAGGFTFLYTKTFTSLPGEHNLVELPDGSTAELNAGSSLRYHPVKWKFQREVWLEGEAYFEVMKGKSFVVESSNGTTRVLGTSFNIYARNEHYRVTCLTGKVEVRTSRNETAVLTPNMHVELEKNKLVFKSLFKPEKAVSWKNNQFFFSGRPLKEVIDEIERQYAVTIRLQPELNERSFGSNFSKKYSVEDVLDIVCKPMKLKFVKQSENVYLVLEES